jgi:hypothetical protein
VKLIDDYVEQFVELRIEEPLDELPIVVREPRVVVSVDEETKEVDIPAVLRELASTETELPLCPGEIMKLREIREGETKDTPEQKYTFELGLPPIKEQSDNSKGRFYSESMYRRLPEEDKAAFDKSVEEYVNAGWWKGPREQNVNPRARTTQTSSV